MAIPGTYGIIKPIITDCISVEIIVFKNKKNTLITTLFKEYQEVPTNRKFIQILAHYINELLNNEEEGKILKDINKAEQNEIERVLLSSRGNNS